MTDPSCNDLATKAELQELRDQLNQLLGEKEDGSGTVEIFQAGVTIATIAALAGTNFLTTRERAAAAVVDIVLDNPVNEPIWRDFRNGNAKWIRVKGNGTRVPLPDLSKIGKVAGDGASTAAGATAVASNAMASLAVLTSLVNIAVTLGLNIATVKILDKRIDAEARGTRTQLDAINSGMLRLYEKNQQDINAVNQQLEENQQIVQENRAGIESVRIDIAEAENTNNQLISELDTAQKSINELQSQNQELSQKIEDYATDFENTASDLTVAITDISRQLNFANQTIEKQRLEVEKVNEEFVLIEEKIVDVETRITDVETEIDELKNEFGILRLDLEQDIDLIDAQSKLNQARLILLENQTVRTGGGGAPQAVTQGIADTQTQTLQLAKQLSGSDIELQPIFDADVLNNNPYFKNTFQDLLTDIETGEVNQQQLDNLKADLNVDFQDILETTLQIGVITKLNDLQQKTSETKIAQATEKGICNSLNNHDLTESEAQRYMGYYVLELEPELFGFRIVTSLHHYYQTTCSCGHCTHAKPGTGYVSEVEGRSQDLRLTEYVLTGPVLATFIASQSRSLPNESQ